MLTIIISYATFNIKMLLKDKIQLIWSIALPLITLIMNQNYIDDEWQMIYWWVYILISSFVYGIGIYALELKENGSLRTIFSIHKSPIPFFFGNLLTQIIYSLICITFLNIIGVLLFHFSFLTLFILSLITILACLPVAFLGYNLTLLNTVHVKSISTIFSIFIFGLFFLQNTDSALNAYNPLVILSNLIIYHSVYDILFYILFSVLIVIISLYSVFKFEPISNERR